MIKTTVNNRRLGLCWEQRQAGRAGWCAGTEANLLRHNSHMKTVILPLLVTVILAGCTTDAPQPTTGLFSLEISPSVDEIFLNKSVDFELVDSATGESVGGAW